MYIFSIDQELSVIKLLTAVKRFIVQAPGTNVKCLCYVSFTLTSNKLQCLSQASIYSLVYVLLLKPEPI